MKHTYARRPSTKPSSKNPFFPKATAAQTTSPFFPTVQRMAEPAQMPEEEEPQVQMQSEDSTVQAMTEDEEEVAQTKTASAMAVQRKCTACEKEQQQSTLQPKLTVGQPGDQYEQEADRVADQVVSQIQTPSSTRVQTQATPHITPLIMRQGKGNTIAHPQVAEQIQHTRGSGHLLDRTTRSSMEKAFGSDFSNVRVHTDHKAEWLNQSLNARAFTTGQDIYFRQGEYQPGSQSGKKLLAHELVHTIQQSNNLKNSKEVQRDPHKTSTNSSSQGTLNGKVKMLFNGEELIVSNDGSVVVRFAATSGRPTKVKKSHAAKCKGKTDESYINNPRYVAIKDHGAIPEGTYHFSTGSIQDFSETEQLELIDAAARGKKNIKAGNPRTTVHTGDWGRGRVLLSPDTVMSGPKPCKNTKKRSGFFLHGGILRGSAGCIDIGSNFDNLSAMFKGNKTRVDIEVKYKENVSTALTECELMFGEVMYDNVKPNPLKFMGCFTELTDNADPEAKKIYEGLKAKFLGRLLGGNDDKE